MSHEPMEPLVEAASGYLQRGLSVIALTGKMPNGRVHPHGLHNAFTLSADPEPGEMFEVVKGFKHPQTTGIGILTGPVYYVVDIDGPEGAQAWKELAGEDWMPSRWVAKTGRGLHLWYGDDTRALLGGWPTTKLGEKLDFKGVGGYVAAPPSLHPDGHRYEWLLEPGADAPFAMPEALLDHLTQLRALREAALVGKQMRKQVPVSERIDGVIYNDVSFEGVIQAVRDAGQGNRNNLLYWAAATLVEDGGSEDDFKALLAAATDSGLPRWEARRTIKSAMSIARD